MQDPAREISDVLSSITSSPTPDIQREAVTRYLTQDAGFRNPFFFVKPGPLSREEVLGVYQWYRIVSPDVEPVKVENVIHDRQRDTLVLDVQHTFHIRLSPLKPVPARLLTRLKLSKQGDLYYICFQEDFFHPDEIFNMLLPPVVPVIRFFLSATGVLSTVFAKSAQVLGFWSTGKHPVEDLFPEQEVSSVSESLVNSQESFGKRAERNLDQVQGETQKVNPIQGTDPIQKADQAQDRTKAKDRTQRHDARKTGTQQVHGARRVT